MIKTAIKTTVGANKNKKATMGAFQKRRKAGSVADLSHYDAPGQVAGDLAAHTKIVAREFTMTEDLDRQVRQALRRRKRFPVVLIPLVLLAVIGAAGAYLWLNYGGVVREFSIAAHPAATSVVDRGEEAVTLGNFQSFERQTVDSLESTAQDIAALKAELKRLSDQISALSARIDAMQSAPQPTGSLEPRPGPREPAISARAPVVGARKKLPAPKTSGPISTGGAPLPLAAPADQ
jgi:hypothetical protein